MKMSHQVSHSPIFRLSAAAAATPVAMTTSLVTMVTPASEVALVYQRKQTHQICTQDCTLHVPNRGTGVLSPLQLRAHRTSCGTHDDNDACVCAGSDDLHTLDMRKPRQHIAQN